MRDAFSIWTADHGLAMAAWASCGLTAVAVLLPGLRLMQGYLSAATALITLILSAVWIPAQLYLGGFPLIPAAWNIGLLWRRAKRRPDLGMPVSVLGHGLAVVVFAFAIQAAAGRPTTWGSGAIYFGVFAAAHTFAVIALLGGNNVVNGLHMMAKALCAAIAWYVVPVDECALPESGPMCDYYAAPLRDQVHLAAMLLTAEAVLLLAHLVAQRVWRGAGPR